MRFFKVFSLLLFIDCFSFSSGAQPVSSFTGDSTATPVQPIPDKYLSTVSSKAADLENKLDKKTEKALAVMAKAEAKMKAKLQKTDSLLANSIFADAAKKYKSLEQKLETATSGRPYIPFLDTLKTSIKFLEQNPELIAKAKEVKEKLKDAMSKVKGLEDQFQKAEDIKKFLKERKEYLKEQLSKLGFAKQLKKINKQVYYYSQQIAEYKSILQDPRKVEKKAIELLSKTKFFQEFMRKNSILASLFRMQGDPNDPANMASLAGLQTRSSVNNLIQQQISTAGPNGMQQFQQNLQSAQSQLSQLKDKVLKFGGSSSDDEIPEGFKPNPARSKTFIQRFTLGTDFQTAKHNNLFPVGSDVGVSVSYMLNARSHISFGSSIKVGWGTGFNHIRISSQGVSFRGGLSWRLRGNLFIAGNYEQNYFSAIRNIDQLRDYSNWKTAALLGMSKKITTKKNKGGSVSLLYDFFYNRPPVRTQPVVMRIGFNLK